MKDIKDFKIRFSASKADRAKCRKIINILLANGCVEDTKSSQCVKYAYTFLICERRTFTHTSNHDDYVSSNSEPITFKEFSRMYIVNYFECITKASNFTSGRIYPDTYTKPKCRSVRILASDVTHWKKSSWEDYDNQNKALPEKMKQKTHVETQDTCDSSFPHKWYLEIDSSNIALVEKWRGLFFYANTKGIVLHNNLWYPSLSDLKDGHKFVKITTEQFIKHVLCQDAQKEFAPSSDDFLPETIAVKTSFIKELHDALVSAKPSLVKKIEKEFPEIYKPPVTYHVGQIITDGEKQYLIAKIGNNDYCVLIDISTGNSLRPVTYVNDIKAITIEEFRKMTGSTESNTHSTELLTLVLEFSS